MRPEYETEEDRTREEAVKRRIEQWRRAKVVSLPKKYPLDFCLERKGAITCFGEVKCRTNLWGAYPTYMISLHKVMAARQIELATGLPTILFVEWKNGNFGWMKFSTKPDSVGWGGRQDREDPQDMEPVCYYNISEKFTMELDV